jgi:hypothetical protein
MPTTVEIACENPDCTLDMMELHYTYEMPSDVGVDAFSCPYCGSGSHLRELMV